MRVTVDMDLCQGHSVCASEAPEVFGIDEREQKVKLLQQSPPEALRARIEAAVRYCPTGAISVSRD
jgi:ferredoxin